MPLKSRLPSRNRATATSSAEISAALASGPETPAARAIRNAGKRSSSGALNSSRPAAIRSTAGVGEGSRSGYVRAYWMGSLMSGVPSCAFKEPSTNCTAEWTTLRGWMTTDMAEKATSYSQRASITSNPLLASVAESIVIFAPIVHVGWRSARSGVTVARSATLESRNGPPDAVSHRRSTAACRSPTRHCQMAECSESIGRSHPSGLARG